MIPVYTPYLSKYKTSATNAIQSGWISNHGINVKLASTEMCRIFGVKHCVLMNNGTSATQCLLFALRFKHPHIRKLYVPNRVFISPINCALNAFAADQIEVARTDPGTMNMRTDEEYILSLERDSAVLVVHNLGNIVNVAAGFLYDQLLDIEHILERKRAVFDAYNRAFADCVVGGARGAITHIAVEADTEPSRWMYCLKIAGLRYGEFEAHMREHGVDVRPMFYDLRRHAHLADITRAMVDDAADDAIEDNGVMLPSYPALTEQQIKYVAQTVVAYIDGLSSGKA
jgi:dTDP-4-amino-4,6-dideoxygalactose transaminase